MTKFCGSWRHDAPVKEESSINLDLLLLTDAGMCPRTLHVRAYVGNFIVKIWHAEESLRLKI